MISPRLFLLGTTLCLGACMGSGLPTIRPTPMQATSHETLSERAYDEGKEHLAAGRAGLAIIEFERAVRLDPLSVNALNGIGAAYDSLKRYDIAFSYYKRALLLAPQNADTVNNIAVSLRLAGDPAASAWFAQAAKLDPTNDTIAANVVQARADVEANQKVQSTRPPEPPASAPMTTVDAAPTLRRSVATEFQPESPGTSPASSGVTDSPAQATLIPVVATIHPPPPNRTETHDTPTPAPVEPRPISAVAIAAMPIAAVAATALPAAKNAGLPTAAQDAAPPTLRRSVATEFQPESPGTPPTSSGVTDSPAQATLIPVVATIHPPPPNHTETHDTPTPAPVEPRPIAAVAIAAVAATALPAAKNAGLPIAAQIAVSNCVGRTHMAHRFGDFLAAKELPVRHITNAPPFDCEKSRLLARAGFERQAEAVARLLPVAIAIENNDTTTDDIRLVLGRDLVAFDRTLGD
jgi:hypothetical protein